MKTISYFYSIFFPVDFSERFDYHVEYYELGKTERFQIITVQGVG